MIDEEAVREHDLGHPPARNTHLTPTCAFVDLTRLWANAEIFRSAAPNAVLMAVIKADAYGHGAVEVARALADRGVDWFAVATVAEAVQLRRAGLQERILVFAAPLPEYLDAYPRYDLDITVSSLEVAQAIAGAAARTGRFRVHVKIETGMGRIGIPPEDAAAAMSLLGHAPNVRVEGFWTHFATADDDDLDFAYRQLERFQDVLHMAGDAAAHIHVATSSAALRIPESFAFDRAMIRIGIGLYGYSARPGLAEQAGLKPVMRLASRVTHSKWVEAGTPVSYDRRWISERRTKIVTVGAGYADGYPRHLTNKGEVSIRGRRYPAVGTVCMDMFMADAGVDSEVAVGDEVVLFGDGGPDAFEIAEWADTIPYEILTGISPRVPRVYVG